MSGPPTYLFNALSYQARQMARDTKDERLAIMLKQVAVGCLILMVGFAANQMLKEKFGDSDHRRPR